MPPTATELLEGHDLGQLLERNEVDLAGVRAPQHLARSHARKALDGRGKVDQVDDAVLVIDELVGNALLHSDGLQYISIDVYEHAAVVYVIDRGADLDAVPSELVPCALLDDGQPVKTEDVATGGRGLFLVSSLSVAWTVSLVEKGKAVIAVLALNGDER